MKLDFGNIDDQEDRTITSQDLLDTEASKVKRSLQYKIVTSGRSLPVAYGVTSGTSLPVAYGVTSGTSLLVAYDVTNSRSLPVA
ncbi:hypothetical protein Hamer_G027680 [Homarus americanus]|uniref:Uncharacterized protein n=1 Tax=Homarus americanus TaxID=6706 RepID=A0A8J5KDW2_HOMAM|nr:hypothetical protein Hamer_G027680 [Homarus americanus]